MLVFSCTANKAVRCHSLAAYFIYGKENKIMKYNWAKVLEENYSKVIDEAVGAYKDSLYNPGLRFIVEIDCDGNVYTWYDIAGGNTYHMSTYKGDSIECLHICNQYLDLNITDDVIERIIREQSKTEYLTILKAEQEEEDTSYESLITDHHPELQSVLEQCIEEREYIYDSCREQLEYELDDFINKCRLIKAYEG